MTHFVDAILEPALWFAADWSLRWAVLIVVIALALWSLRPRRAALRQLLLLVALVGGLLVPFTPHWGDGWERTHPLQESYASPPRPSFPRSAWERKSGRSASRPVRGQAAERPDVRSHAERGNERSIPLGSCRILVLSLVSCWSLAVVYMLIRRLAGWLFLRRLRRESVDIDGTRDLLSACRTELQVRRGVRLAAHPRVRSPILCGIFRSLILVPMDWLQLSPEGRRAVLLHELAHVCRHDHWLAPLLDTIRIVCFFHPLVRWLLARLEYERELLCDEMVVRRGVDPRDYARFLLEFARASGRLAWPAASLPMSRRRTVKGRIHHLLEEDMERWIRPLPARWAVVLGVALLAVTLGLASYRVLAEEKEKEKPAPAPAKEKKGEEAVKPAENKLKREDLRYGGKDFNQWRHDLLTELKGSIRVDGMKAFAAFGANGYAIESTQAILDIMRSYDTVMIVKRNDGVTFHSINGNNDIVAVGSVAIGEIGADAVPVLTEAVKSTNRNVRRFAIVSLMNFRGDAKSAIPALLQAFKSDDLVTRELAIRAVGSIGAGTKEVLDALIEALNDKSKDQRAHAVNVLGSLGESAKPAIPALLKALKDKDIVVRSNAIEALQQVGAGARAVPAISHLLRDEDSSVRVKAFGYLERLKPGEAKEAVPTLIAILKAKDPSYQWLTIETLGKIGPIAKDAIPALNEFLRSGNDNQRKRAIEALKAIDPDGKR